MKRNFPVIFVLGAGFCLSNGYAQDEAEETQAEETQAEETDTTDEDFTEDTEDTSETDGGVESPDIFVPSEEISTDNSVPFPVDI